MSSTAHFYVKEVCNTVFLNQVHLCLSSQSRSEAMCFLCPGYCWWRQRPTSPLGLWQWGPCHGCAATGRWAQADRPAGTRASCLVSLGNPFHFGWLHIYIIYFFNSVLQCSLAFLVGTVCVCFSWACLDHGEQNYYQGAQLSALWSGGLYSYCNWLVCTWGVSAIDQLDGAEMLTAQLKCSV